MIAIGAMYGFAVLSSKWKHPQRWLAVALVLAACGLFASTSRDPVWSFASICFAALGFKAASSLFWPIPQGISTRVAAAVIALINSVGNLGGFVAPTAFGYLEATYGFDHGRTVRARGRFARRRGRRAVRAHAPAQRSAARPAGRRVLHERCDAPPCRTLTA